jgi:hypothetical protein
VWTVLPRHVISRGRPTFTDTSRAILSLAARRVPYQGVLIDVLTYALTQALIH